MAFHVEINLVNPMIQQSIKDSVLYNQIFLGCINLFLEHTNGLQIGLLFRSPEASVEPYLVTQQMVRYALCSSVAGTTKAIEQDTALCFLMKSCPHQQMPSCRKCTVHCLLNTGLSYSTGFLQSSDSVYLIWCKMVQLRGELWINFKSLICGSLTLHRNPWETRSPASWAGKVLLQIRVFVQHC